MKEETLNYEIHILLKDKPSIQFDFHADSPQLAHDHAQHCMMTEEGSIGCEFRKIGNINWKRIFRPGTNYSVEPNR